MDAEIGFAAVQVRYKLFNSCNHAEFHKDSLNSFLFAGKCISQALVCNGDQDCEEDGIDENGCDIQKYPECSNSVLPPNTEQLGLG